MLTETKPTVEASEKAGNIILYPIMPNDTYQVSEDGGNTWENINLSDKGEVLRDFKQNREYYFRVMPKTVKKNYK